MKTVLKLIAILMIMTTGGIFHIYFVKEAHTVVEYLISGIMSQLLYYPAVMYYLKIFNVKS